MVSTPIHIDLEARNRFYRSLKMLLVHYLINLIGASYKSVKRNINNYFLRSLITKKVYHHLSGDMGGGVS